MAEDAADRLVARAIESVLEQVPGSIDSTVPEAGAAKLQPWAETAAPVGRNKRPLEALLDELEQRVTADPDARATLPRTRHPAIAFFDRFGRGGRGQPAPDGGPTPAEGGGKRRRRRRGGGTGGQPATREAAAATTPAPGERPASGRRRSRRGRGGGGGGGAGGREGPMAGGQGTPATPANPPRAPGTGGGGRRRRGRRGRGSAGGDGGGPPAGG